MPFLVLVWLGCFASSVSLRVVDPVVPAIARDLAQPVAAVALLTSAYSFPYALGQPFFGALGDTLGKARIIKGCYIALSILLTISVFAPTLDSLLVVRIFAGLAAGGIVPVAYAMVADRVPFGERQIALTRLMLSGFVAQFVGLIGSGIIGDAFGWRAVIGATSAIITATCLLLLFGLKPRSNVVRAPLSLSGAAKLYPSLLKRPYAPICYGGAAVEGMCMFGVTPFIAVLLEREGLGGVREAGYAIAGLGVGGIAFALVVRRLERLCRSMANMTRLGGTIASVGFSCVGLASSWQLYALALFVAGCGFYMTHSTLVARVTELDPEHRGAAMSLFAFSFFTGQAAGPPLFSLGLATIGSAGTFVCIGLLLLALSVIAAHFLPLRAAPSAS